MNQMRGRLVHLFLQSPWDTEESKFYLTTVTNLLHLETCQQKAKKEYTFQCLLK